jgi:hypothetical protein
MFSVKALGDNNKSNVSICSGVTFGFFDKPLTFEVKSEKVEAPHFIDFKVARDSKRKPFEMSLAHSGTSRTEIIFYNPAMSGQSGLTVPVGILSLEDKYVLGFMFLVDVLPNSQTYRFTYEFYDGLIAQPKPDCPPPPAKVTDSVLSK